MGKNPEEEIQQKLIELELSMTADEALRQSPAVMNDKKALSPSGSAGSAALPSNEHSPDRAGTAVQDYEQAAMNADLCTFGGLALGGVSILLFCLHVHVSAGYGWSLLGGGRLHVGLFLLPIFVGITMLFYNFRSRLAQIITAGSIGLLLFMVLMQLQMSFAPVSLLELVMMILPLCAGLALLMKGHYKRLALKRNQSE